MKKLSILFVSALALGLSFGSCSSDDSSGGGEVSETALLGKWNYSKIAYANGSTSLPEEDYANPCGTKKNYVIFKADEVATQGSYGSDCGAEDEYNTTWGVFDKNELDLGEKTYKILSVNATTLKIKEIQTIEGHVISITITLIKSGTEDIIGGGTGDSIEGKWLFSEIVTSTGSFNGPYQDCASAKDYMELKAGGVGIDGDYDSSCVFTKTTRSWSKVGTKLMFGDQEFTIVSLSSTTLKIQLTDIYNSKPVTTTFTLTK